MAASHEAIYETNRFLPMVIKHESTIHDKYAVAVIIYANTNLSMKAIAESCGVSPRGLGGYMSRHHRPLMYARYGITQEDGNLDLIKIKASKGQSIITFKKYNEAIQACSDFAFIEYNVGQIANMFGLNATGLSSQLHVHYPNVVSEREELRRNLGLADNVHRGVRPWCKEAYSEAVEMYRDTDMTIDEVAAACSVSSGGLSQNLRYYHQDIIEEKRRRRKSAKRKEGRRKAGNLSGNGQVYGPRPETIAKYSEALNLYITSGKTIREICRETGVTFGGFSGYLHMWHRGQKLVRRGFDWNGESDPDLEGTPQYLKSTACKYAEAIRVLKDNPDRAVADVAAQFGFNPEVFREYLKKHEPEIYAHHGMTRLPDGKLVKLSSEEKYGAAVKEYAASAEPAKAIAARHGLVTNSLMGYILRNCPQARESHNRLVAQSKAIRNNNEITTA